MSGHRSSASQTVRSPTSATSPRFRTKSLSSSGVSAILPSPVAISATTNTTATVVTPSATTPTSPSVGGWSPFGLPTAYSHKVRKVDIDRASTYIPAALDVKLEGDTSQPSPTRERTTAPSYARPALQNILTGGTGGGSFNRTSASLISHHTSSSSGEFSVDSSQPSSSSMTWDRSRWQRSSEVSFPTPPSHRHSIDQGITTTTSLRNRNAFSKPQTPKIQSSGTSNVTFPSLPATTDPIAAIKDAIRTPITPATPISESDQSRQTDWQPPLPTGPVSVPDSALGVTLMPGILAPVQGSMDDGKIKVPVKWSVDQEQQRAKPPETVDSPAAATKIPEAPMTATNQVEVRPTVEAEQRYAVLQTLHQSNILEDGHGPVEMEGVLSTKNGCETVLMPRPNLVLRQTKSSMTLDTEAFCEDFLHRDPTTVSCSVGASQDLRSRKSSTALATFERNRRLPTGSSTSLPLLEAAAASKSMENLPSQRRPAVQVVPATPTLPSNAPAVNGESRTDRGFGQTGPLEAPRPPAQVHSDGDLPRLRNSFESASDPDTVLKKGREFEEERGRWKAEFDKSLFNGRSRRERSQSLSCRRPPLPSWAATGNSFEKEQLLKKPSEIERRDSGQSPEEALTSEGRIDATSRPRVPSKATLSGFSFLRSDPESTGRSEVDRPRSADERTASILAAGPVSSLGPPRICLPKTVRKARSSFETGLGGGKRGSGASRAGSGGATTPLRFGSKDSTLDRLRGKTKAPSVPMSDSRSRTPISLHPRGSRELATGQVFSITPEPPVPAPLGPEETVDPQRGVGRSQGHARAPSDPSYDSKSNGSLDGVTQRRPGTRTHDSGLPRLGSPNLRSTKSAFLGQAPTPAPVIPLPALPGQLMMPHPYAAFASRGAEPSTATTMEDPTSPGYQRSVKRKAIPIRPAAEAREELDEGEGTGDSELVRLRPSRPIQQLQRPSSEEQDSRCGPSAWKMIREDSKTSMDGTEESSQLEELIQIAEPARSMPQLLEGGGGSRGREGGDGPSFAPDQYLL